MDSNFEQDLNDIIGYGKKVKVLIGRDKDGKDVVEEFHITPVSLEDLPVVMNQLKEITSITDFTDEAIVKLSDFIKLSLVKMHPNIDSKQIAKKFGLTGMAEAVSIIVDLNDFFSKMKKINMTMAK